MIIGVTGYIGSGKSEVAKYLVNFHGFTPMRFAQRLKDACRALGATEAEVYGADKEEPSALLGGKSWRWAMQTLGTEWGRKLICDDVWVRQWRDSLPTGACNVVVDDVRFPNEVEAIHDRGGVVWRVTRPGNGPSKLARIFPRLGGVHASERYIARLEVDAELANARSKYDLRLDVITLLSEAMDAKYGPGRVALK